MTSFPEEDPIFFIRTRVPRSDIFYSVFDRNQNFKRDFKIHMLELVIHVGILFFEPEVISYESPNTGHFALLNFTKLYVHILESYRSISSKLSKWQNQECLNLKKKKLNKKIFIACAVTTRDFDFFFV